MTDDRTILTSRADVEQSLASDFQRAVVDRFPTGEVNVSAVCIAASGVMAAYLAALPNDSARSVLLESVVASLAAEVNAGEGEAQARA
ncbi:MAG: hypothetical protein K2X62_08200 [Beijerinckiaceae bacterium]|nr:hypothetical protein [Beijerinckiaceae bacterium]MDO9443177.1 hypothetical protein [Beijerinckiaceae bacterium]